ncbi:glycosyl hydrolase 108 family protein [Paraburkholderia terrae]|uniref:glycosyl hydrolase 108 family protein n=1 Tax=Paraburkholderia terrae TaxID=311230 RepID=UPI00296AA150|nr:glycosyl hydrolase 108 family protein [Paraburkholderia terrae]MDW3655134.1 glycosyl hydrolase 108 family protein [Paraburkholderia terrae]
MDNFTRAFLIVVGIEAGLSLDPDDPGNWTGHAKGAGILKGTKYGISAAANPSLDIANLTLVQAKAIYLADYWNDVRADALSWPLACYVFDAAVNQGQPKAKLLLQTALGVVADGVIGPVTLAAASRAGAYQNAAFMTARAFDYMKKANFPHDGHGWFNRLFEIAEASNGVG